ncbi:MAG: VirB3 family type IV secretion system protein [Candidatus Riflebacteria bacterium]|nr:VirB3 family type IV secretion system protein [Candidatus Riflebacteria bacterium]
MEQIKTAPVYNSLSEKPQMLGIGQNAFYLIVLITIILMSTIKAYMIGFGIIAVIILRLICKKEPLLIDFLIESINQQNIYEG